jgi:hypothetical protein
MMNLLHVACTPLLAFLTMLGAGVVNPRAAHAEESPRDYAYGIDLTLDGQAAFFELTVPRVVYEGVVHADLSDVRVFNAEDEVVPHAFRSRVTATVAEAMPVDLPLYPIRTDAPEGVGSVELRADHSTDRTVLELRTPGGAADANARLVGYVADVTALQEPVHAVRIDLPSGLSDLITRVTLEASDDLRTWTPLATDAPIVQLTAGVNRLERRRIEFTPRRVQYLRLSWPGRTRPLDLVSLRAETSLATQDAPREWKEAPAVSVPDKRGRYEVDLGGRYPVDRLGFGLPQPNTVATLGIYSRASALDAWQFVRNATVYRLTDEGTELTSDDVVLDGRGDRYWRFVFDPRGGGVGRGELRVRAGWVPHRIVFTARGAPPFLVAYGKRQAQGVAWDMSALVPGYTEDGQGQQHIAIGSARPEAPHLLAGESAIAEPRDWRRLVLWLSLILSVAVLAAMAVQLARQMSRTSR